MQTSTTGESSPEWTGGRETLSGMSVLVTGEEYEGYVVIDSIVDDKSAGGVRIAEDLPLGEVRQLAREMSLKYALFDLPRGGAKAGIRMSSNLDSEARLAALSDFGSKLAPLVRNGIYNPGMDMNCGPAELRAIYRGAGIELGEITDTSWFTAMSVFHSLAACAAALGADRRPLSLAIEGFGSVARHLAERLTREEFEIVAVATIEGAVRGHEPFDTADLVEAKDEHGDGFIHQLGGRVIDRDALLSLDVDIVLPSSRIWAIDPELAAKMRARAVVPIANAPYADGAVEILHEKRVLCLPGYLSNVGGVLASSLFDLGVPVRDIESFFSAHYRSIADGVLRLSARRGMPATSVAEELARMHMSDRAQHRSRSLGRRVYERFLHRRLPRELRARLAYRSFIERARSLQDEIAQLERVS